MFVPPSTMAAPLVATTPLMKNGSPSASLSFARGSSVSVESSEMETASLLATGGVFVPLVTLTKANPACTWIVGGKVYEFCCPPCVDEFVTLAKAGGPIDEPEAYVQK